MDPSGSGGVPSGADGDPLPEKGASRNPVERQHGLHDIRRGGEPLQEASHKGSTQKGGSVPEPDFPGPEEEWLTTPGGQFETAQSPAGEKEIQDGRGKDNQGPSETGGLDGVHRPQGCISFSPNSPQPPAIPEVLLERSDIRVSMPCIRAQQCSQGVHKAIKASGSTPEKERNPLHDLSGRHARDGPRREGAKASRLLLSGWSKGTNATYQSGWSKWAGWCDSREIDPISCNVKYFLDFLTDLFEQGMQHRSINTIRSAVSMTHDNIEGIPIGQHPLVTRLLRGVHNLRPPKPRYEHTWDVDVVTKHIVKMGSNEDLSLKQLSQKLAVLMALVEASRTSELRALDLRFRVYKPDGVQFRLASLTKKRTPGAPPKVLFFGAFPEEERLCVMKCLHYYEKVTSDFRLEGGDDQPLFLSYTKPHKPVTAQRIAHWIKDLLAEAGVDTKVFKAHSVRGASTSAAVCQFQTYCKLQIGVESLLSNGFITAQPAQMSLPEGFSKAPTTEIVVRSNGLCA